MSDDMDLPVDDELIDPDNPEEETELPGEGPEEEDGDDDEISSEY